MNRTGYVVLMAMLCSVAALAQLQSALSDKAAAFFNDSASQDYGCEPPGAIRKRAMFSCRN